MTYLYEPVYDQYGAVDEPVDWERWQMRQDRRDRRRDKVAPDYDTDYERDVQLDQEDEIVARTWGEEPDKEQIAWEVLMDQRHVVAVRDAAGVMTDMLAVMEMGAHDEVPF